MGRYALRAHIDADTIDEFVRALHAIVHHIETDHNLHGTGELVNTITAGEPGPSWSVQLVHHDELVSTTSGDIGGNR
jgi:hypothetical protein